MTIKLLHRDYLVNAWFKLLSCLTVCVSLTACNSDRTLDNPMEAPLVSAYSVDKIQDRVMLGAYLDQDGWDAQIIDEFNQNIINNVISELKKDQTDNSNMGNHYEVGTGDIFSG